MMASMTMIKLMMVLCDSSDDVDEEYDSADSARHLTLRTLIRKDH